MKKNKKGNSQGCYTPVPVNYTKEDGTPAVWSGRGPRPKAIQAMFEAGTYVPPSVKAREAAKAAKATKRAEKAAAKAAAKAAKAAPAVTPAPAPSTPETV